MNEENHGAVFEAMSVARFAREDEARAKWLDEQIARDPWQPRQQWCRYGHPMDGIKRRRNGSQHRYCLTCNRERTRQARANKAGTSPAMEGTNG